MDITLERVLSLIPKKEDGRFVHGAKKDFAQSLGFKDGAIVSMWINGRSDSYKFHLYEMANKYNVSLEWLQGKTDDPKPENSQTSQSDQKQSIKEAVNSMTRDELFQLIRLATDALESKAAQ